MSARETRTMELPPPSTHERDRSLLSPSDICHWETGVTLTVDGSIDVFIQHWEEAVPHTVEEAEQLIADLAEAVRMARVLEGVDRMAATTSPTTEEATNHGH